MLEAKVENGSRKSAGRFLPIALSAMMGGTLFFAGYGFILRPSYQYQDFLKKEVVTLEGTVIDERYVQPTAGNERSSPSQYFFSIDRVGEGRIGIEVIDSYEPRVHLESVDAKLQNGTRVEVKARNISPGEYKALANEVYVKR